MSPKAKPRLQPASPTRSHFEQQPTQQFAELGLLTATEPLFEPVGLLGTELARSGALRDARLLLGFALIDARGSRCRRGLREGADRCDRQGDGDSDCLEVQHGLGLSDGGSGSVVRGLRGPTSSTAGAAAATTRQG